MPSSPSSRPVILQLAERAEGFALTPASRQAALEAVLDLVTAAAAAPQTHIAGALREAYGDGSSALWFTGETASISAAGFANAMRSAALDLDDGHRKSRGHPGAAVIPAVFAMADSLTHKRHAISDDQRLTAIAYGYETGLRIASARSFYARTGFWAGFAAAAAAGYLAGLRGETLAHAIAIAGETGPHMATTTAPPAWPQPMGSDVKEGIPWGVVMGLSAVPLAKAGLTGPLDLIDHKPFFDAEAILAERAQPAICETYTKFQAACRHIHAPAQALAALMAEYKLTLADITQIHVAAYSGALRISNRPRPANLVDAQYSIPYCLGLVAKHGPDALLPMTDELLHDAEVEAFADKVELSIDPECEARFPAETPVKVSVTFNGQTVQSPVTTPGGDAHARPSWQKRLDKFSTATRNALAPSMRQKFLESFAALKQGDLSPLLLLLKG